MQMNDRTQALIELRDAVKVGGTAKVAGCLGRMVIKNTPWDFASRVISAHKGSLDAAKALRIALGLPVPQKMHSDARIELLDIFEALIAQDQDK